MKQNRALESIELKQDPLVREITRVLKDWSFSVKESYVRGSFIVYDSALALIHELIDLRKELLSETLSLDSLKQIKQEVARKIEQGNALLGLDIIVRDDSGNVLMPDETSTIDLFRAHESAVKRIRLFHQQTLNKQHQLQKQSKQISIQQQKSSQPAPRGLSFIGDRTSSVSALSGDSGHSNGSRTQTSLHVCVNNFNSRMGDDAELLISLFDAKEFKFITEKFLIKINNRLYEERNETNFNVVFTDLGSKDLALEKILLVCQVIRVGSMEMKAETGGVGNMSPIPGGHTPEIGGGSAFGGRGLRATMNPSKRLTDGIRRPFGVGVSDITDIVTEKVNLEEDTQLFVSITTCGERDSLETVLRKVVSNAKVSGVTPSSISNPSVSLPSSPVVRQQLNGIGVWASVKVLHGEDAYIDLNSSTLVCLRSDSPVNSSPISQSQIARKIGFPDIILPGDVRNDLYLTLVSSNFSSKSSASSGSKNIEVTARVCNEKGSVVAGVVSAGGVSSPLVTEYRSVVYHHDMEPKWNETIRVTIPIEEFYGSHVQFLFKHRSSIDSKDKNERPFAFAFIRLGNLNGTAIRDSLHDCLVYKIDKKFDVSADASYLRLPATKVEMKERLIPPAAVNSVSNTNIRSPSPKTPSSPRSSSSFLKTDLFQRKVSNISDSSSHSASSPSPTPAINGTASSYHPPLPSLSNQKAITSYFSQMCPGLTLQLKDSFNISTVICSTKLTQNFDLMALLAIDLENTTDDDIKECLKSFLVVDGEEIVKFLQDSLDALFKIFVVKEETEINSLFFECLIRILSLIADTKYYNFKPVLDSYITDTFSWTLAYNKLVMELKDNIIRMILLDPAASFKATSFSDMRYFSRNDDDCCFNQIMDSLEYLFKFIARSRSLHSSIEGGKGKKAFENSMRDLFVHFSQLMSVERENVFKLQGKFLKNFPKIIPDLITVFDPEELSHALASLLTIIPVEKLKTHKIAYILDVIHMDILFKQNVCRKQLLPPMTDHLRVFMEKKDPVLMGSCIEVLSEILRILHGYEAVVTGSTKFDVQEVMFSCLKTVMDSVIHYFATPTTPVGTLTHASFYLPSGTNDSQILRSLVSVLISLLRQMTPFHFQSYFGHFKSEDDLMDFLIQILMVFQNLISHPVFPTDCIDMILHECQVMLTSLKHVSRCIREFSQKRFEFQLWNNYFHCAISFLTQPLLQLESFGTNKRNTIISKFGDMRREAAIEVRSMWYNLGSNKVKFVPGIVGPFVEMTLIPDSGLRKDTIPIFFDMMHSELLNPVPDPSGNGFRSKGNFREFEKEMITQLDKLVEGGKGDQEYKEMLFEILGSLWETHQYRKQGLEFCKTTGRLMKRLLEYRQVQSRCPSSTLSNAVHAEDNKENRMLCIVNILEFYNEIHRQEMYLRYLFKLLDLHIQSENWIEAGYTLSHYARLLNWSDDPLPSCLKPCDSFPLFLINSFSYDLRTLDTQRQLKQKLYENIIDFFDRGKLWEEGIRFCKDLVYLFEKELYDYNAMSTLLLKMSSLYKNIMTEFRPEPEYFRVSYFGRGFPASIQNKTFICRGKEYEQLISFQSRLSNQFPTAIMMKTLTPPDADITESDGQFILATKVDPVMCVKRDFDKKCVAEQIVNYYRVNDIQTFSFSRP